LGEYAAMTARTQNTKSAGGLTAAALVVVAGLHVMWALGSSFPFRSRDELADAVIGTNEVPSSAACLAVASALFIAATLVAGVVPIPGRIRVFALRIIAATLATRGVAGALGRTSLLSPGSVSPAFQRLDKRIYAPLCLWLASGVRRSI
jgi:hypothetical protein